MGGQDKAAPFSQGCFTQFPSDSHENHGNMRGLGGAQAATGTAEANGRPSEGGHHLCVDKFSISRTP